MPGLARVAAALACALTLAPAGAEATAPLKPYVPLWTLPPDVGGTDTADLGPAPAAAPVSARVYLAGRDPRGLEAYAAAVAYPDGPLFHQYLTAAQVRDRYGPAADQIAARARRPTSRRCSRRRCACRRSASTRVSARRAATTT
jgi:hypothetical protein